MNGAVAAGHPLTAAAGARALAEGGNAVDACVAAAFAAWVAESPLTGPGAGGFALIRPADGRPPRVADFFVAEPGLGRRERTPAEMEAVDIGFGGGADTTQVFRIGGASCAVPGAAAGLEAIHRAYGRLPWREVVAPALELASSGVELNRAQAHLHAILDLILRHTEEGRRLYSRPDGSRLAAGRRAPPARPRRDAGADRAVEGAGCLYRGELAQRDPRHGRRRRRDADRGGSAQLPRRSGGGRSGVRFRGFDVISNPPPSSGGILIAYGLALLDRYRKRRAGSARRSTPSSG